MATRTTSQAGDWSDTATWGGNPAPGAGDRAVVNGHAVTMDASVTLGDSPPVAPAVAPSVSAGGGGTGSLSAGTYFVRVYHEGAGSTLSGVGPQTGGTAVVATGSLAITLPALPTGVTGYTVEVFFGSWNRQVTGQGAGVYTLTSYTSGATAAPTFALTVQSGGTLTIPTGVTLTLRGPAVQIPNQSRVEFQAGSTLEFDSSQAADTTWNYAWDCKGGQSTAANYNRLTLSGSVGSRVTVRSNAGGGNGYFTGTSTGGYDNLLCDWQYFDLTDIGTASIPCVNSLTSNHNTSHTQRFAFGTLTDCGRLLQSTNSDTGFSMEECTFRGTLHASESFGQGISTGTTNPTATREVIGSAFDKTARIGAPNVTVTGNTFVGGFVYAQAAGRATLVADNVIRWTDDDPISRLGDWSGNLMVIDGSTLNLSDGTYSATANVSNPHWCTPSGTATGSYAVADCVFEDFGSTDDGDVDYGPNTSGQNSVYTNCIGISQAGANPGTLATFNGWAGQSGTSYDHCTWQTSQVGPVVVGESPASGGGGDYGVTGMLASYRSNIFWRASYSATVYKLGSYNTGSLEADIGAAANLDYNCGHNVNVTTGVGGNGYNLPLTGTPGANDVDVDPQFVDSSRNFSTWVASLDATWAGNGSPSRTDYNARGLWKVYLSKFPTDPDYDARYTLAAYLTYVRAGFAPTNVLLQNAGHDGVTIGAVEGVFGGSSGAARRRRLLTGAA